MSSPCFAQLHRLPIFYIVPPAAQYRSTFVNSLASQKTTTAAGRRTVLFSLAVAVAPMFLGPQCVQIHLAFADVGKLEKYSNMVEGFTLLRPAGWTKVEKAGATVIFEEGKNSIGVIVNPVRLNNLKDFGTPQFIADKLIQAERKKESTVSAQVVTINERLGHTGIPVYEFEYTVDSTRGGMKRIFSAAFVNSKKLYILNITYADSPENPLDGNTRTVLEEILHSFDGAV